MKFINQNRIMHEVKPLIEGIKAGDHQNILFQGPAGCGKTSLAKYVAEHTLEDFSFQIPVKGNINWTGMRTYSTNIIDEIHEFKNFENLYPLLDDRDQSFIFCTTEYGETPEPFLTRCIRFSFEPYNVGHLSTIVKNYSKGRKFILDSTEAYTLVAEASRGSPRLAKQRYDRIKRIMDYYSQEPSAENVRFVLNKIGIYDFGYSAEDFRYLEYLKNVVSSSLENISRTLRIDKNTIAKEIEPYLLEKGNILITSKGRKFVKWPDTL